MKKRGNLKKWFWIFLLIGLFLLGVYFLLKGSLNMDNITAGSNLP